MDAYTEFQNRSAKLALARAAGLASLSYTVQLDEPQRVALASIVALHPELTAHGQPLEYWNEMLKLLPADEAESPGAVHGFCL